MDVRNVLAALLLCAGLATHPQAVRAAESYDNCNNFIDTLPTTISTQGVWCLRKDLSTNITSGNAITIAANNVTIDCNDFKIGGLAAGPSSTATGIYAINRQNATIRHCNVRGFFYGTYLAGGAGQLMEDNRYDNNLGIGIYVEGGNSLVRRNRVYDTGGWTSGSSSEGIHVSSAEVVDNTVAGVFAKLADSFIYGIVVDENSVRISGNTVSGLDTTTTTYVYGIHAGYSSGMIAGNSVNGPGLLGILGNSTTSTSCTGNAIHGFSYAAMVNCADDGGNGLH